MAYNTKSIFIICMCALLDLYSHTNAKTCQERKWLLKLAISCSFSFLSIICFLFTIHQMYFKEMYEVGKYVYFILCLYFGTEL